MEALDMMAANDKLEFWAATPAKCRYNKDKSMSDWVYLDWMTLDWMLLAWMLSALLLSD
jgi:hypothetical protein